MEKVEPSPFNQVQEAMPLYQFHTFKVIIETNINLPH